LLFAAEERGLGYQTVKTLKEGKRQRYQRIPKGIFSLGWKTIAPPMRIAPQERRREEKTGWTSRGPGIAYGWAVRGAGAG
jgi:hypothetical protein